MPRPYSSGHVEAQRELLLRLCARLKVVCQKVGQPVINPDDETNISSLRAAAEEMVKACSLSDQASAAGELRADTQLGAAIVEAINSMTVPQRVGFLDYLSTQNALLGESNHIISAVLGCNVNTQPLTSTVSSLACIWYIIDYMCKDSFKPGEPSFTARQGCACTLCRAASSLPPSHYLPPHSTTCSQHSGIRQGRWKTLPCCRRRSASRRGPEGRSQACPAHRPDCAVRDRGRLRDIQSAGLPQRVWRVGSQVV